MKTLKLTLLLALFTTFGGNAQNQKLIWAEEFDGQSLDESSWNYELGDGCPDLCGWGNNERQVYTKDNHRLEDGKLIITAKKDGDRYTSTRITTKDKQEFQYGRMETRAKLPDGHGHLIVVGQRRRRDALEHRQVRQPALAGDLHEAFDVGERDHVGLRPQARRHGEVAHQVGVQGQRARKVARAAAAPH